MPLKIHSDEQEDSPAATLRIVDGKTVLDDPLAVAMIRAVEKNNCEIILNAHTEAIQHFKKRMSELKLTSDEAIIAIINADDINGKILAKKFMPGFDWQPIRDRGQIPFGRGLIDRISFQMLLEMFDEAAAKKLAASKGLSVVIVNGGVAEVFPA